MKKGTTIHDVLSASALPRSPQHDQVIQYFVTNLQVSLHFLEIAGDGHVLQEVAPTTTERHRSLGGGRWGGGSEGRGVHGVLQIQTGGCSRTLKQKCKNVAANTSKILAPSPTHAHL